MSQTILRALVGFVPVLLFLGALIYLDSYKLIKLRSILSTIALGAAVAGLAYLINATLSARLPIGSTSYSRYVAPIIEETAKALYIIYLIRSHRIGFLVDAAIFGFAIGAGFAVTENVYYMTTFPDASLAVWLIRGCGTAIMHGGATAIFGVVSKNMADRKDVPWPARHLPGLLLACIIHSAFNHFFFSPVLSALGVLLVLPPLMALVFERSEKSLSEWLNVGFDADTELLELIESGEFSESKVGTYLHSLKERFRGEVVADLLCYLRIHVELSLRAKGVLMLREGGFFIEIDEATRGNFAELKYLEKSVGRTGKLAMAPFLHISEKDLWQLYVLGK